MLQPVTGEDVPGVTRARRSARAAVDLLSGSSPHRPAPSQVLHALFLEMEANNCHFAIIAASLENDVRMLFFTRVNQGLSTMN